MHVAGRQAKHAPIKGCVGKQRSSKHATTSERPTGQPTSAVGFLTPARHDAGHRLRYVCPKEPAQHLERRILDLCLVLLLTAGG